MDRRDQTATKSPQLKSLSEYIQERFDEFSRSQKDVARYIVDHLDKAAFLTAEELARRAGTSSSTVVRFSQALGFEGYPELQQAAIEEYRSATVSGNGATAGGRGPLLLRPLRAGGVAERRLREPRGNRAQPDPEQVDGAVAALAEAQRVVIVGSTRWPSSQLPAPHPQPARHPRRNRHHTGGESLQRLGRIDEGTLVIVLSCGRAHACCCGR